MVSDAELLNRLREIIRSSDLKTTTAGAVRRQLERDFSVDLSDRKKSITQQIVEFIRGGHVNVAKDGNVVKLEQRENGGDGEGQQEQEEEEEEDEEDEGSDDKAAKTKRVRSKNDETNQKKRATGFTKLCWLSPRLQEFVGVPEMSRTEVVKKLWAYIRENDLQDSKNRRIIKCDKKLKSIFCVNSINMFRMNKALSKHIRPLDANEGGKVPKRKARQQKGGTCGFLKPLQLSEAFMNFFGTGEAALSRNDAMKRIWEYIKQHDLQDPSNKRRVLCDKKLKDLLKVDYFYAMSVSRLLTAHLTKRKQEQIWPRIAHKS